MLFWNTPCCVSEPSDSGGSVELLIHTPSGFQPHQTWCCLPPPSLRRWRDVLDGGALSPRAGDRNAPRDPPASELAAKGA
jgi:hypothetical protein